MRISDWSSDVCSSDLHGGLAELQLGHEISDGALAAAQQVEDLPSVGLCEHCEAHESSMPPWLYACHEICGVTASGGSTSQPWGIIGRWLSRPRRQLPSPPGC